MNFNFPNYIKVSYEGIDNIDYDKPENNVINIDKKDYIFKKLSPDGNKGGNSIILKIYSGISIDKKDDYYSLEDQIPDAILKILKYPFKKGRGKNLYSDSHFRLLNEIKALKICKKKNSLSVIDIFNSGECVIDKKHYLYYTMEVADYDLKDYIESKHEKLTFEHKLKLCIEILDGIKEIDINKLYHRDIKPDNIFIVNDKWKIGDLGLVGGRGLDYKFNETSKFIGPRGWISPEVMNKYLTENKNFKKPFDCNIDSQSDIFQLGKLFWYIFQHNAPIGTVKPIDFENAFSEVYPILKTMINYNKQKRYKTVDEILPFFKKIQKKLLLN